MWRPSTYESGSEVQGRADPLMIEKRGKRTSTSAAREGKKKIRGNFDINKLTTPLLYQKTSKPAPYKHQGAG